MGTLVLVAGGAALASVLGGALALVRRPSSLFMSIAFGFASGVLIATVTLEMLPQGVNLSSLGTGAAGFTLGFLLVYLLDLYINRWHLAGEHSEQYRQVRAYHRSHRPRGDRVTVLAGATSSEELIEGLAIGTGAVIQPEVGALIAAAIAIDNLAEGLSIGEFVVSGRDPGSRSPRRVFKWTITVGLSLFVSALIGYGLLKDADPALVGALQCAGGGGMLYLTISQLVPPAEERQYQGSGALASGLGFLAIMLLTGVPGS